MGKSISEQFTEIVAELPGYCMDFFISENDQYLPKTKLAYAQDLKTFFYYLKNTGLDDSLKALGELSMSDIESYMMYLDEYKYVDPNTGEEKILTNSASGKKRKLSTLKSLFKYLQRAGKIEKNPTFLIKMPRLREKEILVLTNDEVERLKENVEYRPNASPRASKFHEKTRFRDMAILSLFLGTGLRVSELAGINLHDIDLESQRALVTRKGGKQSFVYFKNDVAMDLRDYIAYERCNLLKDENGNKMDGPLFVSLRKGRITIQRIEQIVKTYTEYIYAPNVKVTPHTLRKTYGTELYLKYRDLSLVQHALGHSSPATTAKYYTKFDDRLLEITREE